MLWLRKYFILFVLLCLVLFRLCLFSDEIIQIPLQDWIEFQSDYEMLKADWMSLNELAEQRKLLLESEELLNEQLMKNEKMLRVLLNESSEELTKSTKKIKSEMTTLKLIALGEGILIAAIGIKLIFFK